MSLLAVRKTDAESIRSENSRMSLSSTPIERNPLRIAATDAAGYAFMKASTPRTKSRWS